VSIDRNPVNRELERQVLQFLVEWGACVVAFISAGLSEACFGDRDHRILAGIVLEMHARGIVPTWYLVRAEILERQIKWDDPLQFEGFTDGVPPPIVDNIPFMVTELRERAAERRFHTRLAQGEPLPAVSRDFLVELQRAHLEIEER
jgi:hypothetical protein